MLGGFVCVLCGVGGLCVASPVSYGGKRGVPTSIKREVTYYIKRVAHSALSFHKQNCALAALLPQNAKRGSRAVDLVPALTPDAPVLVVYTSAPLTWWSVEDLWLGRRHNRKVSEV